MPWYVAAETSWRWKMANWPCKTKVIRRRDQVKRRGRLPTVLKGIMGLVKSLEGKRMLRPQQLNLRSYPDHRLHLRHLVLNQMGLTWLHQSKRALSSLLLLRVPLESNPMLDRLNLRSPWHQSSRCSLLTRLEPLTICIDRPPGIYGHMPPLMSAPVDPRFALQPHADSRYAMAPHDMPMVPVVQRPTFLEDEEKRVFFRMLSEERMEMQRSSQQFLKEIQMLRDENVALRMELQQDSRRFHTPPEVLSQDDVQVRRQERFGELHPRRSLFEGWGGWGQSPSRSGGRG